MRSKLEVYALTVCFASVVILAISAGIGGYAIIKIIKPDFTINDYQYRNIQSNDDFWLYMKTYGTTEERKLEQRPTEEDLTKRRIQILDRALVNERRDGVQTLVKWAIFFLVGVISFFVHWRIASRARKE
jgi:hypothetical protein